MVEIENSEPIHRVQGLWGLLSERLSASFVDVGEVCFGLLVVPQLVVHPADGLAHG